MTQAHAANYRLNSVLFWCALGLLAAVIGVGLINPLSSMGRFIPLDPNEGWNAYFGQTAIHGGELYPARDALITNNYPPLSFYIVGGVGWLLGDNIFAGRAISLLSLLFVAWSIYYWLRMTGSLRRVAWLGAGMFLGYAVTYGRVYVAMDDPQWLADAIMMLGFLILWRDPDDRRHMLGGALLMMAAGWTKHLLIPMPLATTLWLFWRSRPAFWYWMQCMSLSLAAACIAAVSLYGTHMFASLLEPREYLPHQMLKASTGALKVFAPLLVLWLLSLLRAPEDGRRRFLTVYLLIATPLAIYTSGGAGVDVNAYFDVMIAASMGVALAVETLWFHRTKGEAVRIERGPAAALALAVCITAYAGGTVMADLEQLPQLDRREAMALQDIKLLQKYGHGRAACELPGLCYWAREPFLVDFFYLGQKLQTGHLPRDTCGVAFNRSDIEMIELDPNPRVRTRLLPDYCNAAIETNYRAIHGASSYGALLVPATPAAATSP